MRKKTDPRLSDTRRIKSSGDVFVDLGFDPAEAKVMALRAGKPKRTLAPFATVQHFSSDNRSANDQ